MFIWIWLLAAISGIGHAVTCPKDISNYQFKKVYTCAADNTPLSEDYYRKDDGKFYHFETNIFESGTKRISQRQVHRGHHGKPATYQFTYQSDKEWDRYISSMDIVNPEGQLIRHYTVHPLQDLALDPTQLNHLSPKVLIVDTGFEWTHPHLISKHHYNNNEILNGLDDDGDGWVDNITTIKGKGGYGGSVDYVFNENEALQIRDNGEPISHGTFVSSVAMKNIEHTSFLGASGALDSPVFLFKLLELTRNKGIKFTNMSFGFGDKKGASFIDPESHEAISAFLKTSTDTLHTVAAGNHGINFDESEFSEYPACFRAKNIVTVGALATGDIETKKLSSYQRSTMSSHGTRCVDVMAPGEKMLGAGLYPDTVQASGTSVASPYALNLFLKVHAIIPDLSPAQYKELVLKTVFVPKTGPFQVRSGGILFPERALKAARLVQQGLPVLEAVKAARETVTADNEETNWQTLTQLWQKNRL